MLVEPRRLDDEGEASCLKQPRAHLARPGRRADVVVADPARPAHAGLPRRVAPAADGAGLQEVGRLGGAEGDQGTSEALAELEALLAHMTGKYPVELTTIMMGALIGPAAAPGPERAESSARETVVDS